MKQLWWGAVVALMGGILLVPVGVRTAAEADAPAPATTDTFVSMVGEPTDFIAGTGTYLWYPGSGTVQVSKAFDGAAQVDVSGGSTGEEFEFRFAAPSGQTLEPGSYDDAEREQFQTPGHAGLDVSGEGRGCNSLNGRFIVYDAPADLSRLWIVFEQHCEGNEHASFGEIKYNEPSDGSGLMVAPDRIRWPDTYPKVWRQAVPVTLVNTGVVPIDVNSADITQDPDDFAVQDNDCTVIAPGSSCAVVVNFRPASPGPRSGTLTIADSTIAGTHDVELSGSGQSGYTSWDIHSQTGDVIGLGQDYSYWPGDSTTYGDGNDSQIHLDMLPNNGTDATDESMDFVSSTGRPMRPGNTYQVHERTPDDIDTAAMGMTIGPRGCTIDRGWFTVDQVSYGPGGGVTSFAARFEQHCAGIKPGLVGSVAWRAARPAKPVPIDRTPPGPATSLRAAATVGSMHLAWNDPKNADYERTVVRMVKGTTPPASPSAGTAVYVGTAGHTALHLIPGHAYSFAAFPEDTERNVGRRATLTLVRTSMSMTRSGASVVYGQPSVFRGRVLKGVRVRLQVHALGAHWHTLTTRTTDRRGRFTVVIHAARRSFYRAVYDGSSRRAPAISSTLGIRVTPTIQVQSHRGADSGSVILRARVGPQLPRQQVCLQRRDGAVWSKVECRKLTDASAADFTVSRTGRRVLYRVVTPTTRDHLSGHSRVITLGN